MKDSWLSLIASGVLCVAIASEASAQDANEFRRFDINWNVLSYSRQESLNQYGGTLGFTVHVNERWAVAADLGVHQPININLETTTYRFGPKISHRIGQRVTTFGQFLAGGVRFSDPRCRCPGSVNGFSMLIGGGVDIGIRRWFAIRVVEGGYSGFHLSANGDSGWSNGSRVSGGIVFRFGE